MTDSRDSLNRAGRVLQFCVVLKATRKMRFMILCGRLTYNNTPASNNQPFMFRLVKHLHHHQRDRQTYTTRLFTHISTFATRTRTDKLETTSTTRTTLTGTSTRVVTTTSSPIQRYYFNLFQPPHRTFSIMTDDAVKADASSTANIEIANGTKPNTTSEAVDNTSKDNTNNKDDNKQTDSKKKGKRKWGDSKWSKNK